MAQFQYQPPTGPLSGMSFEEQTELAINDLHDRVDNADSGIADAQTTAEAAQAAANDAKAQAAQAQSTADEAVTGVAQVRQMATDAQTSANNAMTRANDAYDLAAASSSQAGQVATGLSNHVSDKNNPHAVTAAQTGAYTQAETDQKISIFSSSIDNASGVFELVSEAVDCNEKFHSAYKIYLTNASSTNLPPNVNTPAWLMPYVSSDGTAVTQRCWDNSSTHLIYERTGAINNSDPINPVVTWRPWNTIASPTVVKSVTVEVDPPGQPAGTYLVFVMETSTGDVTTYVNLSQVSGGGYTSGNGAIDVSADNKISLQLDPSNSDGLTVTENGLQTKVAIAPDGISTGTRGMVIPDGVTTRITPEGVLSVVGGGDVQNHNNSELAHQIIRTARVIPADSDINDWSDFAHVGLWRINSNGSVPGNLPTDYNANSFFRVLLDSSGTHGLHLLYDVDSMQLAYGRKFDNGVFGNWIPQSSDVGKRREVITQNLELYVRIDGSDSNDGSANSATSALKTISEAIKRLNWYDGQGQFTATIYVGPGSYSYDTLTATGASTMLYASGPATGGAVIQTPPTICSLDTSSQAVLISSGQAFRATNFCEFRLKNLVLQGRTTSFGHSLLLADSVTMRGANPIPGYAAFGSGIFGALQLAGPIVFNGQWPALAEITSNSELVVASTNDDGVATSLTINDNPTWEYSGIAVSMNSNVRFQQYGSPTQITGSALGIRANVSTNSVIDTRFQGPNYLPGNAPVIADSASFGFYR